MSIAFRILGQPGRDNALLVQVDRGQSVHRLLFDCGEGCLSALTVGELHEIDHLFFSHLHMDHVAGFDTFFRCNFDRDTKPNRIWGPPDTARILQHRFQGFLWNLHEGMSGSWRITDVAPDFTHTRRLELAEAFAVAHDEDIQPFELTLWDDPGFVVQAITLNHGTATLAYVVREKKRRNVDTARLARMGLRPGPWLKGLKDLTEEDPVLVIDGVKHSSVDLQKKLLVETEGDSIAYLTDFTLDEPAMERLGGALRGCRTLVCEGQYRHADLDLARRNFHMTTVLSATLARQVQAEHLLLFHLSERYNRTDWLEMLQEAREVFPATRYADHWGLSPEAV